MNGDYISRALGFHGQPLQKIWEDERGSGDLQNWGVVPHANYQIYMERQRYFTFQDRAKRLKLHQFFSRKATDLYDKHLKADNSYSSDFEKLARLQYAKPYVAALPPFELFVSKNQEKFKRLRCLLEGLKPGDVIYGVVLKTYQIQSVGQPPLMVKPLCTAEPLVRYLGDVTIKGSVQKQLLEKPLDKKGNPRNFLANDFVCCEIVDVSVDADRLNLSMKQVLSKNKNVNLGLVSAEELPEYYRIANNNALEKYADCLHKTKEFHNPNYDVLYKLVGLNVSDTFTLMRKLKGPFPVQEYANELRQTQASKWAFRSVAEGIEHFKQGRHVEAFQCLNKALNIDARNVEGLVARGALYANKGSFLKAVDDFEKALKLNSFHLNARKYMGETLVALGRSYEDDNRIEDAIKAYRDCLNIIPNHEQARLSLEALQQHRPGGNNLFDNLLNIPGTTEIDLTTKHKKAKRNQPGVSSSDSDSSDSESDTDSDSSEKLQTPAKRDFSLSPLSKRMAQSAAVSTSTQARNQFSQPFYLANQNSVASYASNDFRLDDDDTESRVRKLLQEASKYKKEKTRKSKKKKTKKSKKESRKDKTTTTSLSLLDNLEIDFKQAFQAITAEQKLTENFELYEQSIAKIGKRKEVSEQRSGHDRPARSDTPPPKAPSMNMLHEDEAPPPPFISKPSTNTNNNITSATSAKQHSRYADVSGETAPRFSFTIKRPVKVDKFGLLRIATPLATNTSPVVVKSRSRSTSPRRERHRSGSHTDLSKSRNNCRNYRRPRSRSASLERHNRGKRSRSRSRTRSHSRHSRSRRSHSRRRNNRSRSRSLPRRGYGRRRTPSPFVPRATPPPRRRSRERLPPNPKRKMFGNRVWQRPGYKPSGETTGKSGRWVHDKFSGDDDGPTIEEIDEIISKAQKERKEEIIKRDKNILKKAV